LCGKADSFKQGATMALEAMAKQLPLQVIKQSAAISRTKL
jgi:hypothetical protein